MIIEAILRKVYGNNRGNESEEGEYIMPDNLKHFYSVMKNK